MKVLLLYDGKGGVSYLIYYQRTDKILNPFRVIKYVWFGSEIHREVFSLTMEKKQWSMMYCEDDEGAKVYIGRHGKR